jgi:hypothetical protein
MEHEPLLMPPQWKNLLETGNTFIDGAGVIFCAGAHPR